MHIMDRKKLLYLDQDLDDRLRALALCRHESVSVIIRDLLRAALDQAEQPTKTEPPKED